MSTWLSTLEVSTQHNCSLYFQCVQPWHCGSHGASFYFDQIWIWFFDQVSKNVQTFFLIMDGLSSIDVQEAEWIYEYRDLEIFTQVIVSEVPRGSASQAHTGSCGIGSKVKELNLIWKTECIWLSVFAVWWKISWHVTELGLTDDVLVHTPIGGRSGDFAKRSVLLKYCLQLEGSNSYILLFWKISLSLHFLRWWGHGPPNPQLPIPLDRQQSSI